jgi:glycosyltransferase involved in cell wall biosynthesis
MRDVGLTDKPEFSIVIPAYNKAGEIGRCLSSVLNQTYRNIEAIVVDDGSTDDTTTVISSYQDERIRLIENGQNKSLLASRIEGMKVARGKYLLFVDADDYLEVDACERLHKWLQNRQCDILEFAYQCEPYQKIEKYPIIPEDIPRAMMEIKYPYTVWNKCYSIELIQNTLPLIESFYCNMSEDGYFSVAFATVAKSYERIDDCLYNYVLENGMSNDAYHDSNQVRRAVESIQNKKEHLSRFLTKTRADLEPKIDGFYQNDLLTVRNLCMNADDIEVQLELLGELDSLTENDFLQQRKDEIKESLNMTYSYKNTDIRGRNRLLKKMWKQDVLKAALKRILWRNR